MTLDSLRAVPYTLFVALDAHQLCDQLQPRLSSFVVPCVRPLPA